MRRPGDEVALFCSPLSLLMTFRPIGERILAGRIIRALREKGYFVENFSARITVFIYTK